MPEISTAKPQIQSRSRLGRALLVAGKTLVISVFKTLYALWLEVTGLVFAVLTVMGANDLVRHYRIDHLADRKRLLTVSLFILVCAWFTVLSYVRAQKTRK
jgi:hypothetical protein